VQSLAGRCFLYVARAGRLLIHAAADDAVVLTADVSLVLWCCVCRAF
jgi:hypothetical protein